MARWHDLLKALALGTVPVVGAFLALLLLQASSALVSISKDEARLAVSAGSTLDTINRKCAPAQPCGTLAEVGKLLTHTSDLVVQGQKAIRDADRVSMTEAKMLPAWNAQFTQTLANIDNTVATVDRSATELTQAAMPVLNQANTTLATANKAVAHLDALETGPEIKDSLKYIAASSASIADGTKQADAILQDTREEADKFTHPPKKKLTFWGAVLATVEVVHKFEPPIF